MQKYRPYLVAAMLAILMTIFIAPEIHEGNGMSPIIENGDVVILVKETYSENRGMPELGDLVVLSKNAFGGDYAEDNPIRRVTGLPGDAVVLEDGTKAKVGKNQVFIAAENPGEVVYSDDKETGLIDSNIIKGKVVLRIWPFDTIGGVQ